MAKKSRTKGRRRTKDRCVSGGGHVRQAEAKELSREEGQGTAGEQRYPYMAALPGARGEVNSESRFFRARNDLRSEFGSRAGVGEHHEFREVHAERNTNRGSATRTKSC